MKVTARPLRPDTTQVASREWSTRANSIHSMTRKAAQRLEPLLSLRHIPLLAASNFNSSLAERRYAVNLPNLLARKISTRRCPFVRNSLNSPGRILPRSLSKLGLATV